MTRALIVAVFAAATAAAAPQPPTPAASPAASPSPSPRPSASPSPSPAAGAPAAGATSPDIEIIANVRWKELRFEQVGTPTVVFSGNPTNETVWEAERDNLPKPVQPGVTYRDGGIRLVISTRFQELARALEEAAAPASSSPAASPSPSPSASPSPSPRPR
jgi:hypothetical protein